ncbi:DNA-binding protein [Cellulomonas sp. WB94]|uniref:HEPN domain-containing protein n=1 Tax=Cellulomonas sp. WB94 TaxID=2173174 RepID=UPI000D579BE8|nr:HEPN domain-containing protein [Cellulomonas sp. WB94]PVU83073.1 DNA-binding protein [Cellulomonas sp. WB94]
MGALEESQGHLRKAKEFLTAASLEVDLDLFSAAASSAVLAGINAKDAICLRLAGRTGKSDDHRSAVPELAAAGPAGKALESTFRRLLGLKTTAQYQSAPISRSDATKAVGWATRMVDAAADATGT